AVAALGSGTAVGSGVGLVYAANTAGSIAGTIAAGFLLVPRFGTHQALACAAVVHLVVALGALARAGDRIRPGRRLLVLAPSLALALDPWVESIDLVEIERAVVEALPAFAAVNGAVYADPRVHVHVADGRTFLLTTRARYDVIVSEPSNPWMAGVANLFTDE